MSEATNYYNLIITTLQGKTSELEAIPSARLDWEGPGAVLETYDQTSGDERDAFITAMRRIIEEGSNHPEWVVAQLIDIASSLDITQAEPAVRRLQSEKFASNELVRTSIDNFLAERELMG